MSSLSGPSRVSDYFRPVERGVLLSSLSGPSRVSDYFRPVERGLRLDRDLERLWWKLFIHVNSDLSEISQEQLWLLDTSASRGRQSVANMMTSFAFSCLSHHRGVIGDAETPRFPAVNVHTEHWVLSLPPDTEPTVPPPPDPKPVIWSVSMGVIRDAETPRFPAVNVHTEHRVLSLPPDAKPTVPPPPDPKLVIWSVSMGFRLLPLT